jgi:hypothetical protein
VLSNDVPPGRDALNPVLLWSSRVLAIGVAWYALTRVIRSETPIDGALPLLGAVLLLLSFLTVPAIAVAVPVLAVCSATLPDERTRLLAYGVVVAISFMTGIAYRESRAPLGEVRSAAIALLAIVILRWLPEPSASLFGEVLVLFFAVLLVVSLRGGPLAIAAAVVVSLFTPAIPLRTLILPLVAVGAAAAVRVFSHRRMRMTLVAGAMTGAVLLLFAWSGVVARALPLALRGLPREVPRHDVGLALRGGESLTLDVPPRATALIVSGANVPRLERGAPLGIVNPGGRVIRIGDASDWGTLRLEHFYDSRNPLPAQPAGLVRDYGYSAWIDGAGKVPLPPGAQRITITGERTLRPGASLQVHGFEVAAP